MPNAAAEFQVPLSDFQRVMLQWQEQHPFLVADVVALRGPVDAAALRVAAQDVLLSDGIARPRLDVSRGVCTFQSEPCQVETVALPVAPATSLREALERHTTAELRRPFHFDADPPIRLWLLTDGALTYVGMTWQHWLADGMSAGDLLHRILARVFRWPVISDTSLNDWRAVDANQVFGPWLSGRRQLIHAREVAWTMATNHEVAALPRMAALRAARCHFLDLPIDALERIRRMATPHQATVNDVLVAAVGRALAATLPRSAQRWWRRRIRIANIVDLRPSAVDALRGKAGLFLGLANWDCPAQPSRDLASLIDHVRRQSQRTKRGRLWMTSLGGFRTARLLWPWLPSTWRRPILSNIMRVSAVMTNLRYPERWYEGAPPGFVDACWRAVPTSLMAPLTVGVTTLGQRLTMTLSCDESGPIADCLDTFKNNLVATLS